MLGLTAGALGGMLGIGGSLIMIPIMVILLDARDGFNQHLFQAAAMIINALIMIPAVKKHSKAGAVMRRVLVYMMPSALIFIFVGVWLSNTAVFQHDDGAIWLGRIFSVFLTVVMIINVIWLIRGRSEVKDNNHVTGVRCGFLGMVMGMTAGIMGIGGGGVAVPMQQAILRLPLRNCIANSSAVICLTAGFGAIYKNYTLGDHTYGVMENGAMVVKHLLWTNSVMIAVLMAPSAIIGGHLGSHLTHILPDKVMRVLFILLLTAAALKMARFGE